MYNKNARWKDNFHTQNSHVVAALIAKFYNPARQNREQDQKTEIEGFYDRIIPLK